ncbi:MAG: leucine-rich repeat domain-containing protein, partial [Eubacteriales bacterium]|nr:leucine-rich repeat domain-containing protein [Eubacteriales bacterium]
TDLGNGDLGNGDTGNGDTEPGNEDSGNKGTDVEQQSSSTANTNTISGFDPKMPSVFSAKKQTAKKLPLTFTRKRVTYQQIKSTQKAVKVVAVHDKARKVKIPAYITWKGTRYKVVEIGKNAFLGCKKLSKVTIGKQVTVIGAKAFYGCNKLRSVIFQGKKLNKIQKKAFAKTHAKIRFKMPRKKQKKYIRLLKKSRYAKVSAHLQKKCGLY